MRRSTDGKGFGAERRAGVSAAHFRDNLDISRADVLWRRAEASGLDMHRFQADCAGGEPHQAQRPLPSRPRRSRPSTRGTAVPAPARPARTSEVRWERRHLTLFKATVAEPAQDSSASGVARVVHTLGEKVRAFGSHVEGFSPTAIVAAFGLEPAEGAPLRAAHAAIAVQHAAGRAQVAGSEPVVIKVAIHAGSFLVTNTGETFDVDVEAMREALTTLQALIDRAEPDTIVVSEGTASLVERRFELAPLDSNEVAAHRAYRVATRPLWAPGAATQFSTFVGRRHELELLRSRMASAMFVRSTEMCAGHQSLRIG